MKVKKPSFDRLVTGHNLHSSRLETAFLSDILVPDLSKLTYNIVTHFKNTPRVSIDATFHKSAVERATLYIHNERSLNSE